MDVASLRPWFVADDRRYTLVWYKICDLDAVLKERRIVSGRLYQRDADSTICSNFLDLPKAFDRRGDLLGSCHSHAALKTLSVVPNCIC